jgi:hypothetical protein
MNASLYTRVSLYLSTPLEVAGILPILRTHTRLIAATFVIFFLLSLISHLGNLIVDDYIANGTFSSQYNLVVNINNAPLIIRGCLIVNSSRGYLIINNPTNRSFVNVSIIQTGCTVGAFTRIIIANGTFCTHFACQTPRGYPDYIIWYLFHSISEDFMRMNCIFGFFGSLCRS